MFVIHTMGHLPLQQCLVYESLINRPSHEDSLLKGPMAVCNPLGANANSISVRFKHSLELILSALVIQRDAIDDLGGICFTAFRTYKMQEGRQRSCNEGWSWPIMTLKQAAG